MPKRPYNRGLSIVEILMAAGMAGMVIWGTATVMKTQSKTMGRATAKNEWQDLREALLNVNCATTFTNAGFTEAAPGANCSSTSAKNGQVGPFFPLRINTATGAKAFPPAYNATQGWGMIGKWAVRASCSSTEQTLIVRVARPKNPAITSGTIVYDKDEISGELQDFYSSTALLIGKGSGGLPYCFVPATAAATPIRGDFQSFSANGNFTVPAGVTRIMVEVWSGGGGGGSYLNSCGGFAGGFTGFPGGYARSIFSVTPGAVWPVVVGAGGAAGAVTSGSSCTGTAGSAGGNSTFGISGNAVYVYATGGPGAGYWSTAGGGTPINWTGPGIGAGQYVLTSTTTQQPPFGNFAGFPSPYSGPSPAGAVGPTGGNVGAAGDGGNTVAGAVGKPGGAGKVVVWW